MRAILVVLTGLIVVALGFWAYRENYATQQAIKEVRELHAAIGAGHERLNMLDAEWAYLNRPDRLRDLADLNFERLGLLPLIPEAFGRVDQISYPMPEQLPILNSIEVSSDNAIQGEGL
ncbi:MAG: cell division protein FtsL [Rhodobacteraceae bacterium]|nr:cell division protein FtsL [Paracoccaceae bacterium]